MRDQHFLTTPKGVFIMGVFLGAMGMLAVGFFLDVSGMVSFGGQTWRDSTPAAAPIPDTQPPAATGLKGAPPPVSKDDHVRGAGKVTIIEYGDFQCPFCRAFHQTMQQLQTLNSVQVRWVFRHFPLTSIHPQAESAAEAAECANDQGKFWEMTDAMYAHQADGLSDAQLAAYAKEAGVKDAKKFAACLAEAPHAALIAKEAQDAEALGADGTPYSIAVNAEGVMQEIPGALPISNVKAIVDALAK